MLNTYSVFSLLLFNLNSFDLCSKSSCALLNSSSDIILISGLSTTIHSSSGNSFLVPVIKSVTSDFLFVTLPVYIGFLSILTIDVCTHFDLVFFVLIPLSFKFHAILVVPIPLYT